MTKRRVEFLALSAILIVSGSCRRVSMETQSTDNELPINPGFAGHHSAEALVIVNDQITVLATADTIGQMEHAWILRLALDGELVWQRHYDPSHGNGKAMLQNDGSWIIVGSLQTGAETYQGHIMRLDSRGVIVDEGTYAPRADLGESDGIAWFDGISLTSQRTLMVGGHFNYKGWLLELDDKLRVVRQRRDEAYEITALLPLPNGMITIGQTEWSTTTMGRTQVTALSNPDHKDWEVTLPTHGRAEPGTGIRLADGSLIVVGSHVENDKAKARSWVVKLTASGVVDWEQTYGKDDQVRAVNGVVEMANGDFVIAGQAFCDDGTRRVVVSRLSSDGTLRWEKLFGDYRDSLYATGIARTPDGSVVVVGSTTKGPGKTNVLVMRLSSAGELLWQHAYAASKEDVETYK
jgi:hypothetical protein